MAQIIDFKTRQRRDPVQVKHRSVKLLICDWRDAREGGLDEVEGSLLVGGVMPLELVAKFQAMCEEYNAFA